MRIFLYPAITGWLLLAPATLWCQKHNNSGLDPDRLALLRPRMRQLVDDGTIPGAVALVSRHGKTALLEAVGWADIEDRKPMKTDSIFQIMSMTKNFTGVAAMLLVEEGKLELRRKVEDYLPEFQGIEVKDLSGLHAPEHAPTVWQLMCHTSGLAGNPGGDLKDNPQTMRVPLADAVRFYAKERLLFEPGTRWHYSNIGIAVLGRIVEVISGDNYVHFVQSRILEPLGMKDSFFFPPAEKFRASVWSTSAVEASWSARARRSWRAIRPGIGPVRNIRLRSSDFIPLRPTCCAFIRCC